MNFLKSGDGNRQSESPLVLIQEIRKKVQSEIYSQFASANTVNGQPRQTDPSL
jgi:hypothetical protein